MIYFLDTCVLIDAKRLHFPIAERPSFWGWLLDLGRQGSVKIPEWVFKEIDRQRDDLSAWADAHRDVFQIRTADCVHCLPTALAAYGAPPLDEAEIETLEADPYLVAHALAAGGAVVTNEIPSNATLPKNKRIPAVCMALGLACLTLPAFMWETRRTMP